MRTSMCTVTYLRSLSNPIPIASSSFSSLMGLIEYGYSSTEIWFTSWAAKKTWLNISVETKKKQFSSTVSSCLGTIYCLRHKWRKYVGLLPWITQYYCLQRLDSDPESLPLEKQLKMMKATGLLFISTPCQKALRRLLSEVVCYFLV